MQRRKPSYGAAARLARIVYGLTHRPFGWSFDAIQDELGVSERTLKRYLSTLRIELVDNEGNPLVEAVRRGNRRILSLVGPKPAAEGNAYEIAFFYFAMTLLRFLDGTVIKEGVDSLWERLERALPGRDRLRLENFDKKFFTVPYGMKDYSDADETLDVVVQSLVFQRRLRIRYSALHGGTKTHTFDPYTLTSYRGGLYLIGRSDLARKAITIAVERIESVKMLDDKFDYPRRYSPERYTEGMFGLVDGPETKVELVILNDETARLIRSRRIHPTQKFQRRRDGTTLLTMTVRGTTEVVPWVMSLIPWVRVRKPKSLRDEVHERIAAYE